MVVRTHWGVTKHWNKYGNNSNAKYVFKLAWIHPRWHNHSLALIPANGITHEVLRSDLMDFLFSHVCVCTCLCVCTCMYVCVYVCACECVFLQCPRPCLCASGRAWWRWGAGWPSPVVWRGGTPSQSSSGTRWNPRESRCPSTWTVGPVPRRDGVQGNTSGGAIS